MRSRKLAGGFLRFIASQFFFRPDLSRCGCDRLSKSSKRREAYQSNDDPYQLTNSPKDGECDSGKIGIAMRHEKQQIPAFLCPDTPWNKEGTAFNDDSQGSDGDRR